MPMPAARMIRMPTMPSRLSCLSLAGLRLRLRGPGCSTNAVQLLPLLLLLNLSLDHEFAIAETCNTCGRLQKAGPSDFRLPPVGH